QQNRWINRNDIATTFHITDRRASLQLSYILEKKCRIASRRRNNPLSNLHHNRYEIWVESIIPVSFDVIGISSSRQHQKNKKNIIPSQRRVGSGMTGNVTLWEDLIKRRCDNNKND
ncbi:TPA: CaiF/GrlA family transcriptional regulator, partial [Escherichia coli]|nr:CaiF/GrlA family transcriptional regulator [Escherichia coli]